MIPTAFNPTWVEKITSAILAKSVYSLKWLREEDLLHCMDGKVSL